MKPAILLGSFDPPTNGHLHLISEALIYGVPEIYIVPTWKNPWKSEQTDFLYRYSMCKLLEIIYPRKLKALDIERTIANTESLEFVPTYITLKELKKTLGDFYILTTNETCLEIPKWTNGYDIIKEYNFLVFSSDHLGEKIEGSIVMSDLPISSSMVRERLELDQPCQEYIPESIYQYIKNNNLYEKISVHN